LQVLPSLAVAVGLNEALFLQQLHYWLLRNGKERDGRRWIYNTYEEWHAQLPFWSVRTIRRVVGALEEQELVFSTTAYNSHRVDKTKWYAINYDAVDALTESSDHVANLASPLRPEWPHDVDSMAASVPETTSETNLREPFLIPELGLSSKMAWHALLDALVDRATFSRSVVDTWLRPAYLAGRDGDVLLIAAPNSVARDRIETRMLSQLQAVAAATFGMPVALRVVVL
jgi:hypothetical protein